MSIPIRANPLGYDSWFVKVTRAFNNSIGEPGKVRSDYVPGNPPVLEVFVNLDVSLTSVEQLKLIAGNSVPSGVSVEWYWENGLPMNYTRLEYIENIRGGDSGAASILTDVYPTHNTHGEMVAAANAGISAHSVHYAFGSSAWVNNLGYFSLRWRANNVTLYQGARLFLDERDAADVSNAAPGKCYVQFSAKEFVLNGVKKTINDVGAFESPYQLMFMSETVKRQTARCFSGKAYSFKLWEGDKPILNYIPALDPSGVPGMYDTEATTAENTFKKSVTGTQFVAGMTLQQVRDMKLNAPGSIPSLSLSIPCEVYNDSEAWGVIEAAQQNGWAFTFYWTNVVAYLTPQLNDIVGSGNYTIAYDYRTNKLNLAFALSVTDEQLTEVESLLDRVLSKNIVIEIDPFPIDCTRVEYLESTGSQYINTEYYLEKADDYVMVDVAEVRRPQYWGAVWGTSNDAGPSYNLELKYYKDDTKFRVFYGDKYTYGFWEQLGTIPSNRNLYVIDGGQCSCNGISVGTLYPADFKCTAPASLFCIYNGTNPGWSRSALRIFGFEIRRAGESTLNFIPALDPTGVACMFDSLTRKAFRNVGTGQFIAGVETQQQLDDVLSGLPNRTGQDGGELYLRLSDTLYDAAVASGIIEKTATAKNWQIAYDPTTITEAT